MADRSNQCLENLTRTEAVTQADYLMRTRHANYPFGPGQNAHQQAGYMFAVEPNLHLQHLAKPGTFIHVQALAHGRPWIPSELVAKVRRAINLNFRIASLEIPQSCPPRSGDQPKGTNPQDWFQDIRDSLGDPEPVARFFLRPAHTQRSHRHHCPKLVQKTSQQYPVRSQRFFAC